MFALPVRRAACVAGVLAAACSGPNDRGSSNTSPPPPAEFLLGSADSTFWVASAHGELRVRGAPLIIAKYDGRFYEVYAHHDDMSYPDALLLGDRIYRRDLLTGDSTLVFADTTVPRIAAAYARAHPDERPLGPDEDGEANPSTSVSAEVDVMDVFGPYLSYEYHIDVELPGKQPWHSTRQGVLDLRTGTPSTTTDLFGRVQGQRLIGDARRAYTAIRDSVARQRPFLNDDDRRAANAIAQSHFDEASFSLSSAEGRLSVNFVVPGRGEGAAGNLLELDPLEVDSVAWWSELASGLPVGDDAGADRWRGRGYQVLARYDTTREIAQLSLADATKREWPIASTRAPLFQVLWLDDPPVSDAERRALITAFNHAASYGEGARVALTSRTSNFHFVTHHAPSQDRSRKPARIVRAHDARACEQHGPCVRRRDSVHDGQNGGDRGISSQPRQRRDGFDRPRRFSRADSSRRPGGDEGQRQLRGAKLDGSRRPR